MSTWRLPLPLALLASALLLTAVSRAGKQTSSSPHAMRAVLASSFGLPQQVLYLADDVVIPNSDGRKVLIRTEACSLSPGDWRMLSGDARSLKYPDGGFPYIPGLDVCGKVVKGAPPFTEGESVVATWGGAFGTGGLADYSLVEPTMAVRKPEGIGCIEGAALANSAPHALSALRAASVKPGERLLVLGGSGGVGTAMLQIARAVEFNVSYLAATSSDTTLLLSLGVDRAIDYSKENWWELQEYQEQPFDVIIDCAQGVSAWRRASSKPSILKRDGRFLAVVLNEWHITAKSLWDIPGILLPPLGRTLWSLVSSHFGSPRYIMYLGALDGHILEEVMALAAKGSLRAVLDPSSPLPFTDKGAVSAFDLLRSRHAKGKIVVNVQ